MRKALLLTLALGGQALATSWEYASYSELEGVGISWDAPGESVTDKKIDALMKKMGCGALQGINGLLNCVGAKGWELVTIDREVVSNFKVTDYIFKRPKP